jgi:cytochrome c-type biogenesis protein CcmH
MVDTLAAKLRDNPNDVDGWALLGRSYFVLGRYADAAEAYASGSRVVNDQEPDLLVNQGESLALAGERNLQGRPMDLFRAALALDPDHGKALWYAGLAAEQAGVTADARRYWTALSNQTLPEELRTLLDARLQRLGGAIATPAPGPAAATATATATAAPVLRLDVSIAAELTAQAPDDAVLFVFARAAGGPPMPLAVHRGRAGDLPRRIVLDDSMSMQPGLNLSGFDRWEVVARISRAGGVQAASGDLQGSLTVARPELGEAALVLQIDQVIP